MLTDMVSQGISGPERFIAVVAGDDNSFQMVCFYVVFYVCALALFSTHLCSSMCMICKHVFPLGLFHHGHHFLIQFVKIPREVIGNSHSSVFREFPARCLTIIDFFQNVSTLQVLWGYKLLITISVFHIFIIFPHQTFQLQLFSNSKERIKVFLVDICIPTIKKVNNGQNLLYFIPLI